MAGIAPPGRFHGVTGLMNYAVLPGTLRQHGVVPAQIFGLSVRAAICQPFTSRVFLDLAASDGVQV